MPIMNPAAIDNARQVRTGKDAAIYDDQGTLLATVETFTSQFNFSNAQWQPVGSFQQFEVPTGYGQTVTLTNTVVKDEKFIEDIIDMKEKGLVPHWNFTGAISADNGTYERMVYNDCIPSGNIDIQNINAGDIIKRAINLFCNGKIRKQGSMRA